MPSHGAQRHNLRAGKGYRPAADGRAPGTPWVPSPTKRSLSLAYKSSNWPTQKRETVYEILEKRGRPRTLFMRRQGISVKS